MFPHHSSIHHFVLNDPPSPKSRPLHLEYEGDRTPTEEYPDPLSDGYRIGEKVSRVASLPYRYSDYGFHDTQVQASIQRLILLPTHLHRFYMIRP